MPLRFSDLVFLPLRDLRDLLAMKEVDTSKMTGLCGQ